MTQTTVGSTRVQQPAGRDGQTPAPESTTRIVRASRPHSVIFTGSRIQRFCSVNAPSQARHAREVPVWIDALHLIK